MESPLTEKATEAIYKSQNLCDLSVVIEKGTPIPSASLPNLIHLEIECEDGSDVLQFFHRASFGKLESVDFTIESRLTDDFLEAFQGAALSSSIQDTLSAIWLRTDWSWNPKYSSLPPFKRLVDLKILFPCEDDCSGLDDDVLVGLSRAMPKLESLWLGDWPCEQFTGGATARGLAALARNCPNLSSLRVHFQVAGLGDPPTHLETTCNAGHTSLRTGCAQMELDVGEIPVPEGSASMIALALLRIFPRIQIVHFKDRAWGEVEDMICRSKQIVDCSGKCHKFTIPQKSSLSSFRSQSYDR